jgi:CHASE3 domain sensor protein
MTSAIDCCKFATSRSAKFPFEFAMIQLTHIVKSKMKKFLTEKWFILAVAVITVALVVNMVFTVRNNLIIERTTEIVQETEEVALQTDKILTSTMHRLDIGVRGFGLTKDAAMLDPYHQAIELNPGVFRDLGSLLKKQNYPDMAALKGIEEEINAYIGLTKKMVDLARIDSMETFNSMLKLDKGYDVWIKYEKFAKSLKAYEDNLRKEAYDSYKAAVRSNFVLQVVIVVLTVPVLFFILMRIRSEQMARRKLLNQVEENDRKYVFNSGSDRVLSPEEIIETSIQNTRKASEFIKTMANGNYAVEWDGLNGQNAKLNDQTLAGDLINMREKLKTVKAEDEKRNWMNEGLAKFSEIVRNHQHEPKVLADKCVSFLTKYLASQQGSLFVLEGEEGAEYLNLASSYAFDKKKWVEKRIEIGNGLIGQAYLEGDITQLKDVPNGYTQITSGLGDATPKYIVIVPLKYDVHTVAVVELASFTNFEAHHTMFLKKAGEFLASAILNSQTTQKMKALLDNARMNEEQLRAQEEEMRQNMEELQATQEELVRKEKERMKRAS